MASLYSQKATTDFVLDFEAIGSDPNPERGGVQSFCVSGLLRQRKRALFPAAMHSYIERVNGTFKGRQLRMLAR